MEVTRSNFQAVFPHVASCVNKSDFIAIDTEFTGLHAQPDDEPSFFDSMEGRYQKLKRFAQTYTICQFGLAAFVKDHQVNKYVAHTFNFYLSSRECADEFIRITFQASNAQFLCDHKFDFNKMFHEGIGHLNSVQEVKAQSVLSESELEESVGFTKVFRLLVNRKKPLLGHNMLNDLALLYEKFHRPLPDSYTEFKKEVHRLFPVVIDTKNLCFALQKRLSGARLVEFTSLVDLYEALGSQRGVYYVLYSPDIVLAEEAQVYNSTKVPHEAGFDAYCVGYVFLRLAHLSAMRGVGSSHAHPVHLRQYYRLMEPYTNKVNLIRGPIKYINLSGEDSAPCRSQCLVISRKDGAPLSMDMLTSQLAFGSMDIQLPSPTTAYVILSSQKRADQLLSSRDGPFHIQEYSWWHRDTKGSRWRTLVLVSVGLVAIGLCLTKFRTFHF